MKRNQDKRGTLSPKTAFCRNKGCFLLLKQTFQKKVGKEEVDSIETDSRGFHVAVRCIWTSKDMRNFNRGKGRESQKGNFWPI